MEYSEAESKPGLYDVYYAEEGQKLIVLEGLDPDDQFEPSYLQEKIHAHYELIAGFYWALLIAVIAFVSYRFLIAPLIRRRS